MTLINVVSLNSIPEFTPIEEPLDHPGNIHPSDLLSQWEALSSRCEAYRITNSSALASIETARTQLCEWAYLLVDHYQVERSIVAIAFSMFDRYVAAHGQNDLELLALSCVYTAIKVHSTNGKMPVGMLVKLTRSSGGVKRFTAEQIESMEFGICTSLQWHVNPPTLSMFLDVAFDFIEASTQDSLGIFEGMRDLAIFLAEISVIDVYFSTISPSAVAAAALTVARKELSASKSVRRLLKCLHTDDQETKACALRLSQHYANWKSAEEKKKNARLQSASPTGVGMLEDSPLTNEGEGNSLREDFEEETVGGSPHGYGGKRKRAC